MPAGRPTIINDVVIAKLESAFSLDCTVLEACFYADISKDAFYDLLKKRPELSDRFEALRQKPILSAREAVITSFKKDPTLALKYLERKKKNEFSLRQELTGKDGKDLPTPIMTLDNVQRNNGNQENSSTQEEN